MDSENDGFTWLEKSMNVYDEWRENMIVWKIEVIIYFFVAE